MKLICVFQVKNNNMELDIRIKTSDNCIKKDLNVTFEYRKKNTSFVFTVYSLNIPEYLEFTRSFNVHERCIFNFNGGYIHKMGSQVIFHAKHVSSFTIKFDEAKDSFTTLENMCKSFESYSDGGDNAQPNAQAEFPDPIMPPLPQGWGMVPGPQ